MNSHEPSLEKEPIPKDISQEFLDMSTLDFFKFLREQRHEPLLSITIDWRDEYGIQDARRLKAFLEDSNTREFGKQKRTATIRATKEQHEREMNVFASGVKWEKVE